MTYETIRKWCRKFGQQYANQLRRRRPRLGDKWHMDEVFLTIKGRRYHPVMTVGPLPLIAQKMSEVLKL